MKLRRAGPEMEKPPLVVVLCGLGYQIHPFTREVVLPHICIPQSIPLLPCGGFIGSVLRTLMGRTRSGLCLPSPCAPIIAEGRLLVNPFRRIFSQNFWLLSGCPDPSANRSPNRWRASRKGSPCIFSCRHRLPRPVRCKHHR